MNFVCKHNRICIGHECVGAAHIDANYMSNEMGKKVSIWIYDWVVFTMVERFTFAITKAINYTRSLARSYLLFNGGCFRSHELIKMQLNQSD